MNKEIGDAVAQWAERGSMVVPNVGVDGLWRHDDPPWAYAALAGTHSRIVMEKLGHSTIALTTNT